MFNLIQKLLLDVPAYYNHEINHNISTETGKKKVMKFTLQNKERGFDIF